MATVPLLMPDETLRFDTEIQDVSGAGDISAPSSSVAVVLELREAENSNSDRLANESESFDTLLSRVPHLKRHLLFRLAFALIHGTGLRCRGMYPINLLLVLTIIAGATSAAIFMTQNCRALLREFEGHSLRAVVGVVLRYSCNYLIIILFCGEFVTFSVFLHKGIISKPYEACFPNSTRHQVTNSVLSTSPISRRNLSLRSSWKYEPTVLSLASVVSIALNVLLLYKFRLPAYTQGPALSISQIGLTVLWSIFNAWCYASSSLATPLFYAVVDDVVQVCQDVGHHTACSLSTSVSKRSSSDDATDVLISAPDQSTRLAVAKRLLDLKKYTDAVLKPWRLWFAFHMAILFLMGLFLALSGVFLLVKRGPSVRYPFEGTYDAFTTSSMILGYLFPLHAAARVTNVWDNLVHQLRTDYRLLSRCPVTYHSMALYVGELGGGFVILGRRVQFLAGLKLLTIIMTLAGLTRLF